MSDVPKYYIQRVIRGATTMQRREVLARVPSTDPSSPRDGWIRCTALNLKNRAVWDWLSIEQIVEAHWRRLPDDLIPEGDQIKYLQAFYEDSGELAATFYPDGKVVRCRKMHGPLPGDEVDAELELDPEANVTPAFWKT